MSATNETHRPGRRRRLPLPRAQIVYMALVIGAGLLTWHLWVKLGHVPPYLWPSLGDTVRHVIHSGTLRGAAADTALVTLFGFLLAIAVGLLFALLTVSFRGFELAAFPVIVSSQFIPLIALAPLFIVWWGFGVTPKLIIITLVSYFSVLASSLTGLRALEVEKIYLAQTMGATTLQQFWKIRLPNALPHVFAGLKITITSAVIGAVIAEFTVGSSGLGYEILKAQGVGDSVTLVGGVIWLAIIGGVGFLAVAGTEYIAIPWSAGRRGRLAATPGRG
jgi:NitT/TauT family transport system permease protein